MAREFKRFSMSMSEFVFLGLRQYELHVMNGAWSTQSSDFFGFFVPAPNLLKSIGKRCKDAGNRILQSFADLLWRTYPASNRTPKLLDLLVVSRE